MHNCNSYECNYASHNISPALNGSSDRDIDCISNVIDAIKILCDGLMFSFYLGLSHIMHNFEKQYLIIPVV